MQIPAFPLPIHLGCTIVVLPLVPFPLSLLGFFVLILWGGVCLFLGVLFGFFVIDFLTQLYSFLCFHFCGGMKDSSQPSIFASKGLKMVRWPPSVFLKSTEYYMKACHTGISGITKCFHAVIPWIVCLCCLYYFYVSFIMEVIYPSCEA